MKINLNFVFGIFLILVIVGSLVIPIFAESGLIINNSSTVIDSNRVSENDYKIEIKVTQEDKDYFNNELGLSNSTEIKESSVRIFKEEEKRDGEKFSEVANIAKIVEEKKREAVSIELVEIKKEFLEEMNKKSEVKEDREKLEKQLDNYVKVIEENKDIEIKVRNIDVKEYFETKNEDKLINSMVE
ncbi:hypothetical protein HN865_02260 [Candidatus Woesearchaeota archaeon]|jgi:hypothetical protein|nr:hypothetical protein [Candidatus Woesearchaeota archaeon]